jgi:hypothetical protein
MSNTENFQWTDELAAEFAEYFSANQGQITYTWGKDLLKLFKGSKRPKKMWEIISIGSDKSSELWQLQSNGLYKLEGAPDTHQFSAEHLLSIYENTVCFEQYRAARTFIHSVRSLSDDEIFTVGDNVRHKELRKDGGKIERFTISCDLMVCWFNGTGHELIHTIEKPLFTTADGKPIYKDDRAWFVDKDFKINFYDFIDMGNLAEDLKHYPGKDKYFSTQAAAEEYVINNKPSLSLKDIEGHVGTDTDWPYITNLVKSRL